MVTSTRRKSLAALLPTPTVPSWGVWLHFENGQNSDKEYRIAVDGNRTCFQWGKRGASGESSVKVHADHDTAVKAALKQWAAKEAKGYWPITGVLPLEGLPSDDRHRTGDQVIQLLVQAYEGAVEALRSARVGSRLWLCQAPSWDSPWGAASPLWDLAQRGGLSGGRAKLDYGAYFLVSVTEPCGNLIAAVCPVAVELGTKRDEDTQAVAQIASVLAAEVAEAPSAREALAAALDAARAIAG